MNASTLTALLGGIGLFLLGMRMMTDGLKLAGGNALRSILQSFTSTNSRGLLAGVLITAIVQSSSAVTVATVGFVNAGLLTLSQAVWVVFGTNIGTTMTGWLVALVGVKIDVGTLALPLIGIGMLLRLAAGGNVRRAGLGEAIAGFGVFFLGVGVLQNAFSALAPRIGEATVGISGWEANIAFVGIGILLTMLTQSSSATIAITLTAAAGGSVPLAIGAPMVIGANIGTTSTAIFAALGATAPAKRVAGAHIAFNVITGVVALALLPVLLVASDALVSLWSTAGDVVTMLAAFHTLFNVLGIVLMWPLASLLVRRLERLFVSLDEELGRPKHLDRTLLTVPALALRGLVLELERMADMTFDLAARRVRGVAVEPASRERQEGLLKLGLAIDDFVGELAGAALPADITAALPDLLRANQHLEDLAADSAYLGRPRPVSGEATAVPGGHAAGAARDWAAFRESVLAALGTAADRGPGAASVAQRLELDYEALKNVLLRAGASGRLRIETMEEDLRLARRLRRLAESALKARRRLARWHALAGNRTDAQPAPEASAERATGPVTADALGND